MKRKIFFCLKFVIAGLSAFILLNILCFFYYNVPIHKSTETKSTDYIWQANKFYSKGTEGFAVGTTDKNGFNNLKTFEKNDIDVLVMGSSHMEAFNVAQSKNTVTLLNDKSKNSRWDLNFYNIGISGHDFVRCLYNLENAICEFAPQKYVVIETQTIEPNIESLEMALQHELKPIESHNEGIIGELQKFPYLRLMYSQIKSAKGIGLTENPKQTNKNGIVSEYYPLLNELINKKAKICKENGIKLIIFYNCQIDVDAQGNVMECKNIESVNAFNSICEKNDIIFIDMYNAFKNNYIKTKKLPRGFSNSKAGTGHLNEEGHCVIARELFDTISKLN